MKPNYYFHPNTSIVFTLFTRLASVDDRKIHVDKISYQNQESTGKVRSTISLKNSLKEAIKLYFIKYHYIKIS